MAEWQRLPLGFLEQLIEYRQFARDWSAIKALDTSEKRAPYRGSGFFDLAEEIEVALVQQEIDTDEPSDD